MTDAAYVEKLKSQIKDLEDQIVRLKSEKKDIEKDCDQAIQDQECRHEKELNSMVDECERDVLMAQEWAKEILESVEQKYGRRVAEQLALDAKIRAS